MDGTILKTGETGTARRHLPFIFTAYLDSRNNQPARKEGTPRQGILHFLFNFTQIVGWFFVIIVYINVTKDRTTFVGKIMGVSLTTFLVILFAISFFTHSGRNEIYDLIHERELNHVMNNSGYHPRNSEYVIQYSLSNKKIRYLYKKGDWNLRPETIKSDFPGVKTSDALSPTRRIRDNREGTKRFISYSIPHSSTESVVEAGLSYIHYSKYPQLHNKAAVSTPLHRYNSVIWFPVLFPMFPCSTYKKSFGRAEGSTPGQFSCYHTGKG